MSIPHDKDIPFAIQAVKSGIVADNGIHTLPFPMDTQRFVNPILCISIQNLDAPTARSYHIADFTTGVAPGNGKYSIVSSTQIRLGNGTTGNNSWVFVVYIPQGSDNPHYKGLSTMFVATGIVAANNPITLPYNVAINKLFDPIHSIILLEQDTIGNTVYYDVVNDWIEDATPAAGKFWLTDNHTLVLGNACAANTLLIINYVPQDR